MQNNPYSPSTADSTKPRKSPAPWKLVLTIAIALGTGALLGTFISLLTGSLGANLDTEIIFLAIVIFFTLPLFAFFLKMFFLVEKVIVTDNDEEKPIIPKVTARIEPSRRGFFTFSEGSEDMVDDMNYLMRYTLTVFPNVGVPYKTTISQLIEGGKARTYTTGTYVAFIEDETDPGYGSIDTATPATDTEKYDGITASVVYPFNGFFSALRIKRARHLPGKHLFLLQGILSHTIVLFTAGLTSFAIGVFLPLHFFNAIPVLVDMLFG